MQIRLRGHKEKNKVVILMSIPTAKEKRGHYNAVTRQWRLESRHGVLR